MMRLRGAIIGIIVTAGCVSSSDEPVCGPVSGVVSRIVDGDTIVLASGLRVRYLMVDTPELGDAGQSDCFAEEARRLNAELVLGREVRLRYDAECEDRYGRLLAYVSVADTEVNRLMVERGYACTLHVPPNGDDRQSEFGALEAQAKSERRGMWGACGTVTCENKRRGRLHKSR